MAKNKRPGIYQQLQNSYPNYLAAVEALGQAIHAAGPLDEKTAHLVQLAAAAAVHSEGAVHSHVRRAQQAGVTAQEIRHALISITSTIGFPSVVAALSWATDVLETEKPGKKRAGKKK